MPKATSTKAQVQVQLKPSKQSKPIKKQEKTLHRWNRSLLKAGDFFSCHQYMQVVAVKGSDVTLKNERGQTLVIDKQVLLNDSYSADHFEKEVSCTMTQLAEILKTAKDTVFQVEFEKKLDDKMIFEELSKLDASDFKNASKMAELSKSIIVGQAVSLVCHLVKSENHLGRSLVIDLNSEAPHNFKQVDHRTIKSIILRNVKYTLGKKSTLDSLQGWSYHPTHKWNESKLAIGNWFSENQYYKISNIIAGSVNAVICNESQSSYFIPISQVHDMFSGSLFDEEKQVTRTELVEILLNAKESVFTCTFHKKVTPEFVQDLLKDVKTDADLSSRRKELAKSISLGQ